MARANKDTFLTIRLDPETRAMADKLADIEDRTLASLVRVLIRKAAQRRRLVAPDPQETNAAEIE